MLTSIPRPCYALPCATISSVYGCVDTVLAVLPETVVLDVLFTVDASIKEERLTVEKTLKRGETDDHGDGERKPYHKRYKKCAIPKFWLITYQFFQSAEKSAFFWPFPASIKTARSFVIFSFIPTSPSYPLQSCVYYGHY